MPSRSATSFLRRLARAADAEAQQNDLPVALAERLNGAQEHGALRVVLERAAHGVGVRAENVREQQLVAVPVSVERLIDAHLRFLRAALAQVHEDLVFDAARGVGRELDVLVRLEGMDGLDEADRADRDQVLDVNARVFKPARDVHHQPQVVLDEQGSGLLAPGGERPDGPLLCLAVEWGGHGVAPADVKQPRRAAAQPQPQRRPERM